MTIIEQLRDIPFPALAEAKVFSHVDRRQRGQFLSQPRSWLLRRRAPHPANPCALRRVREGCITTPERNRGGGKLS